MTELRALTLWQPWATFVAVGVKRIETRSWSTDYRGPLLVHAAARPLGRNFDGPDGMFGPVRKAGQRPELGTYWYAHRDSDDGPVIQQARDVPYPLPFGAHVALANLADVVPIVGPGSFVGHSVGQVGEELWEWSPSPDHRPPQSTESAWWHDRTPDLPFGDYTPGRFAWLFDHVLPLTPIDARGRQQLWKPDPETVARVLAALPKAWPASATPDRD